MVSGADEWANEYPHLAPVFAQSYAQPKFDIYRFRSYNFIRQGIWLCVSHQSLGLWDLCLAGKRMAAWVHPRA
jgi:hypothetical protein